MKEILQEWEIIDIQQGSDTILGSYLALVSDYKSKTGYDRILATYPDRKRWEPGADPVTVIKHWKRCQEPAGKLHPYPKITSGHGN